MTRAPHRLALLIPLMGLGLHGTVRADDDALRSAHEVDRVMRVLGLDTGVGPVSPSVATRAEAAAARAEAAAAARAVQFTLSLRVDPAPSTPPAPRQAPRRAPREVPVSAVVPVVVPQPVETVRTAAIEPDPPVPDDPPPGDPPDDPDPPPMAPPAVATAVRPLSTPDSPEPVITWTLDALLPPEPPAARPRPDPVAAQVDGIDAYEALIARLAASGDEVAALAQAERVMDTLAGVRFVEVPLPTDEPPGHRESDEAPAAWRAPSTQYLEARLADAEETAAGAAPTDRVLGDLATLVAAPAPSPSERVLDDLARVRNAPWDGETVAMDTGKLDRVRGGFMTDTGLKLSFGIERAVYINGNLVTQTSLNVADLGAQSGGRAATATVNGALAIVQNGPGNTVLPGTISQTAAGTVIQNTLDNQKIQNITTINATVNSMQVLRALNLQHSVRTAITDSIRR